MTDTALAAGFAEHVDNAMAASGRREERRGYIGLSTIGKEDLREIFLDWRWSLPSEIPGRTLRIFRMGHLIEHEIVRVLRAVDGVTVMDVDAISGDQFAITDKGGHVGGHCDGFIVNLPFDRENEYVLEAKSAKDSEFKKAKRDGVQHWRPEYMAQCRGYMDRFEKPRGLFAVYNKDTSEIYWEVVYPQVGDYMRLMDRVDELLSLSRPPDSIYKPTDYRIKNFKHQEWQDIYWGRQLPPPHCRTCVHAQPLLDGHARWWCHEHKKDIPIELQRTGCSFHRYLHCFLDQVYNHKAEYEGVTAWTTGEGIEFWNAKNVDDHAPGLVFDSLELYAMSREGMLNSVGLSDTGLHDLRETFSGRIRPT